MELSIYDVIKGPVLSQDAYKKSNTLKQWTLAVHMDATKPLVKEAMKKLFNVEVDTVRINIRPGKRKRVGRTRMFTQGSDEKRAIVTLKEGYSLDLYGTQQAAEKEAAAKKENK